MSSLSQLPEKDIGGSALSSDAAKPSSGFKRKRSDTCSINCADVSSKGGHTVINGLPTLHHLQQQLQHGVSALNILRTWNIPLPATDCTTWDAESLHTFIMAHMPAATKVLSKGRTRKTGKIHDIGDFVRCLQTSKRIVVIVGAGISVSCGIPDFRSPTTGLYDILRRTDCAGLRYVSEPQELFDYHVFCDNPNIFYSAAPLLYAFAADVCPSPSHQFLKFLEQKTNLSRIYTQNIDGLEHKAGVSSVVQCHGTLETLSCIKCGKTLPCTLFSAELLAGTALTCPRTRCKGFLKPDAVFFRQPLPLEFEQKFPLDIATCDLLVVMGTSMKVQPIANAVALARPDTPVVLINKETIPKHSWDLELLGDSDVIVEMLRRMWDGRSDFSEDVNIIADASSPERWHVSSKHPAPCKPHVSLSVLEKFSKLGVQQPPKPTTTRSGRQVKPRVSEDGIPFDLTSEVGS